MKSQTNLNTFLITKHITLKLMMYVWLVWPPLKMRHICQIDGRNIIMCITFHIWTWSGTEISKLMNNNDLTIKLMFNYLFPENWNVSFFVLPLHQISYSWWSYLYLYMYAYLLLSTSDQPL